VRRLLLIILSAVLNTAQRATKKADRQMQEKDAEKHLATSRKVVGLFSLDSGPGVDTALTYWYILGRNAVEALV
jgi:hypothetical protein